VYQIYFASCMNIIFNELRQQRVKYVHTIFYHILSFYTSLLLSSLVNWNNTITTFIRFNNVKLTKSIHWRFISFQSRCLSQCGVGEWGQPDIVQCQFKHTEDSKENARRSELLDVPGLYAQRSSSVSKSLEYSIENVRISTISNSSSGRSLSFYKKTSNIYFKL